MLQVHSTFASDSVELSLKTVNSPMDAELQPGEVVIKIQAAPINPSDIARMVQMKPEKITEKKDSNGNAVTSLFTSQPEVLKKLQGSNGYSAACGSEGAGVVVKAGKGAEGLVGKVVAVAGGKMYAEFLKIHSTKCIPHLEGTTPKQAASSFVNPMTVLCFIETMKRENHKAIIHTAAASNLGQMLLKLCLEENIPLINIVRKESQQKLLEDLGAKYVVRSDKDSFKADLINAIVETKASLCFDAIGGGKIQDTILTCMEIGAQKYSAGEADPSSFYGSTVLKQLYVYGGLDFAPTVLKRGYGMSWGIGGYLMPNELQKLKPEQIGAMFGKIAKEINTTFKSEYYREISLKEVVQKEVVMQYIKQETGKKFLVNPSLNSPSL